MRPHWDTQTIDPRDEYLVIRSRNSVETVIESAHKLGEGKRAVYVLELHARNCGSDGHYFLRDKSGNDIYPVKFDGKEMFWSDSPDYCRSCGSFAGFDPDGGESRDGNPRCVNCGCY